MSDSLFKGSISSRLFSWYIFLAILNNILVEPLTLQSRRIPSGYVKIIPEVYKGNWNSEEYDDSINKLSVKNSTLIHIFSGQINKCKSPYISYGFEDIEQQFEHKFWFPIIRYIILPIIPDTIFGRQYINWKCPNPKDNTTDYILTYEPTLEYYPRAEMVLFIPFEVGYDEYQSIEYMSQSFSKYLRK